MEAKFSQRVKEVITYSREEAMRLQNDYIGVEHLLLGLIREGEGLAVKMLNYLGVDLIVLRKTIEQSLKSNTVNPRNIENIPLVKQAERILKITYLEAKFYKSELIGTEHLLLSILKDEDNIATRILNKQGISYDTIKEELKSKLTDNNFTENLHKKEKKEDYPRNSIEDDDDNEDKGSSFGSSPSSGKKQGEIKSKTPVLDNFGRDLTRLAEENRLDPVVG
ncbi:MAG: ATP-dependent Clp protease ATP-binding subunit, partial [Bacteroidetes bacterium]|nr:ATP-dependent Clp protease ATP-binding subunit [Bacteroidota bacterium]